MKLSTLSTQRQKSNIGSRGFTLMETVIAILVVAVLLTGFLTVFTSAAKGIRRSISNEQADRLTATLERDMTTLRVGEAAKYTNPPVTTGFDKAFTWIIKGNLPATAIFVYQYRGNKSAVPRADGSLEPLAQIEDGDLPGIDYITQTASRRMDDSFLFEDLDAIVGPLLYVIPTQLVNENNELALGDKGAILNSDGTPAASPTDFRDAVITFSAAFYMCPTVSPSYLQGAFANKRFTPAAAADSKVKPIFIRNLAVRR